MLVNIFFLLNSKTKPVSIGKKLLNDCVFITILILGPEFSQRMRATVIDLVLISSYKIKKYIIKTAGVLMTMNFRFVHLL